MTVVTIVVVAVCLLAFVNGANDNPKGVATLIGGKTLSTQPALIYAAIATFLGSVAAILLAGALVAKFGGKGLVADDLLATSAFPGSVALAAALTVLVATRIAMPISTTHALVGGIVGVGLSARALNVPAVVGAFLVPLAVAPLLALVIASIVYPILRFLRLRLGVTSQTCVCIEREYHPVNVEPGGALIMASTGLALSPEHTSTECFQRYDGNVVGVDAQRVLDWSHLFSAGAISFARGLNDTPKMAALIIAAGAMGAGSTMLTLGVAIVLGGLLAARRVAHTMSHRITEMNDGQAFTANLVTAGLVIFASKMGVPVSTTHVSCGSLFGIGLVNRRAHLETISRIVLAWVTTLPLAAAIGFVAWRVLSP